MDRSDLAERMKGYEKRNRYYLQRRMPVILRLDMRAGHSIALQEDLKDRLMKYL